MEIALHKGEHCTDTEEHSDSKFNFKLRDDSNVTGFGRCYTFDFKVTNSLLESLGKCEIPTHLKLGEYIDYLSVWIGFPYQSKTGPLIGYMQVYRAASLLSKIFVQNPPSIINLRLDIGTLMEHTTGYILTPAVSSQFFEIENGSNIKYANKMEFTSRTTAQYDRFIWEKHPRWYTTISVSAFHSFHFSFTHKMLHGQLFCDAVIFVRPNIEIKCHRSVLAAHSPVLAAMFETDMKEGKISRVELVDMSEESVRALLEYLYSQSTTAPDVNSQVCFELLQAGLEYQITSLKMTTEKILLEQGPEWYTAEAALRLFLFSRAKGKEILRQKALRIMKLKYKELEQLPGYRNLLKKNIDAVNEIIEFFASVEIGSPN